ncbi:MAG: non-canonical purine NTP pyrophosphatase [Candidatus Woesearchaeota archaeon]
MKKINYFTSNKNKVETLKISAKAFNIKIIHRDPKDFDNAKEYDLLEPRSYHLKEIARIKAIYASKKLGLPLIVTDEGFYLDRWPKFPGSFTNFALDTLGLDGILKLAGEDKGCSFKSCLAYIDDKLEEPIFFESDLSGTLAPSPRGRKKKWMKSDLGYIYMPEGYDKTLAQMTENEYVDYKKKIDQESYSANFLRWYSGYLV